MPVRAVRVRAVLLVAASVASLAAVVSAAAPAVADPAPGAPGTVVSVDPARVLDTRSGNGAPKSPIAARGSVTVQIAGRGGLPPAAQVAAVFLTVTVTQPRASGYLSVRPTGGGSTGTSTLNFSAGQTLANSTFVALGAGGQVTVENVAAGSSQVILDVTGFTWAGPATEPGAVVAVRPARIVDTRSGTGTTAAPVGPRSSITVGTVGRGGLPLAGIGAVLVNLTATNTRGSGNLALAASTPPALYSSLNWTRTGQTVASQVQVPVDHDGRFVIANRGSAAVAVVADVQGYVLAGGPNVAATLASVSPQRIADTRGASGGGPVDRTGRAVSIDDLADLPPYDLDTGYPIQAVVVTVTVTRTTSSGYLTVWAGGSDRPLASTSNWAGPGQTVANLAVVPLEDVTHRSFTVAVTGGRADVVVDLSGYVLLDPAGAPPREPTSATGFQQDGAHDGHSETSLPSSASQRWDVDFAAAGGWDPATTVVGRPLVTVSGTYAPVQHEEEGVASHVFDLFHVDNASGTVDGPVPIGSGLAAVDLVYAADRIITVDSNGRVAASSLTGEEPWEQQLSFSQPVVGTAAVGDRLFVASNANLWALDATSGEIAWHVTLPAAGTDPVVAADSTGVYVAGGGGQTATAYSLSGTLRWTAGPTVEDGAATPALHHGRLWTRGDTADAGTVLDAATGTAPRAFTGSRPVAFVQDLALTLTAGVLTAVGESDGATVWTQGTGDLVGTPLTTPDTVYVPAADGTVRGYAVGTGRAVWSGALPQTPSSSRSWDSGMSIGDDVLVVPNGTHLTAFGAPVA
ncbi:outer membrane protein assembly factor BamB family protein [Jatrophihabitans sp. YIM 134969]